MTMLIEEYCRGRINKLILEDFGINNEIDTQLDCLGRDILKDCKNKTSGRKTVVLNNKKITVLWAIHSIENDEKNVLTGYDQNTGLFFFPIYTTNGQIDIGEFNNILYHELGGHAFQTSKMGHNFGNSNIYAFAKTFLRSENKLYRYLAYIFYMMNGSGEQDAMINGLWGVYKAKKNYIFIDGDIQGHAAFTWFKNLHVAYKWLEKNKNDNFDEYESIKRQYDIPYTYEKVLFAAVKSIRRYEKKLSRVIFKIKKDKMHESNFRPYINPETPPEPGAFYTLNKPINMEDYN